MIVDDTSLDYRAFLEAKIRLGERAGFDVAIEERP
jgi:hypothetical protein